MRKKILYLAFVVWVALWAVFTVRELFWKQNARDYAALISRTLEGKRAYVTGDDLYAFILFCGRKIPEGATYAVAGIDPGAIEKRRLVYYLYPRLENGNADYLIVYGEGVSGGPGYSYFDGMDKTRYILKKAKR